MLKKIKLNIARTSNLYKIKKDYLNISLIAY